MSPGREDRTVHPMARHRAELLTKWEHGNAAVAKLFIDIKNGRDALEWASEHVGYVIDASHGPVNV